MIEQSFKYYPYTAFIPVQELRLKLHVTSVYLSYDLFVKVTYAVDFAAVPLLFFANRKHHHVERCST